ncbi:MAG: hypothetical protein D6780_03005 [Candidatus Dadabacteria bacterium]|nr:MAG: hypothetical protein D6780_03005 [Candidatus Dadabacteria bacterium]
MNKNAKEYFLNSIHILFGVWLLYVAVGKWIGGPAGFVGYITSEFQGTWVPQPLQIFLAWVIMFAEPLCALWILSRKTPRLAWTVTALFLFMLTFGQTILRHYDVVANNWQYVVLALVCAALSEDDKK